MEIRRAAKAIITARDNDNLILLVASRSRLSLPGGGINRKEKPAAALARELNEEVLVQTDPDEELEGLSRYITEPIELFEVEGIVTPRKGPPRLAQWIVSRARLLVPAEQLVLPGTQEIRGHSMLPPVEYIAYPEKEASFLAQTAVAQEFGLELPASVTRPY